MHTCAYTFCVHLKKCFFFSSRWPLWMYPLHLFLSLAWVDKRVINIDEMKRKSCAYTLFMDTNILSYMHAYQYNGGWSAKYALVELVRVLSYFFFFVSLCVWNWNFVHFFYMCPYKRVINSFLSCSMHVIIMSFFCETSFYTKKKTL